MGVVPAQWEDTLPNLSLLKEIASYVTQQLVLAVQDLLGTNVSPVKLGLL